MVSLIFWKNWPREYRNLWLSFLGLFLFSVFYMAYCYFQGANGVIDWERIEELKTIETTVHQFKVGPFHLTVPAESFVIFEYLQGSDLHHNTMASYIFFIALVLCALLILSVITTLDKFWFLVGTSLFILFLISLRLDVLLIFGVSNSWVPAVVLIFYVGAAWYFNRIRPETGFSVRFATFGLLTIFLAFIIFTWAAIPFPFLHLAVTGYTSGLILSVVFFFMVAHEIMASFITIASRGGRKPLRDFLIISTIYLANVLITCLHQMGTIQWNFIYINVYLLLFISTVLGLWGFRHRENLYGNIVPFSPFGALFYVALATICIATLGQLLGNANDAALKVVEDLIIFTHTGFAIVFLMYVFSNFMVMMAERIAVDRVLYRPNRMPYFTFRLAGVIVTLAFVFVSHWRDYVNHSVAGFYTYAADLYMMQDNEQFGRALYERSRMNSFQNHRANYALAMIKLSRIDFEEATKNFEQANKRNATEFSLVNQGNLLLYFKQYFPAIRYYRDSDQRKPSLAIKNNLGFAYAKVHNLDSAAYFIGQVQDNSLTRVSAEQNFFGMIASEYIPVKADSILRTFNSQAAGTVSNALAAATLFNQKFTTELDPLSKEPLNLQRAMLLNNYIIKHASSLDSTFTNAALAIANDSANFSFSEPIKSAISFAFYQQGNVTRAQQIAAELIYRDRNNQGKMNYIQGLWALENENPIIAKSFFEYAAKARYKNARLYYAIACLETGNRNLSYIAWDSVAQHGDRSERQMAARLQTILTMTPQDALTSSDADKYQFTRYVLNAEDTMIFSRLSNTFDNPDYKAQSLLDMSRKQFAVGNKPMARRFFNQISGLELADSSLYNEVRHYELRLLADDKNIAALANAMKKGVSFQGKYALSRLLYDALVAEANGDADQARRNYQVLGMWNPYYVDGLLAAADFFKRQDERSIMPYTILSEAIQLNNTSPALLEAYIAEATRKGMDEYAANATQRLNEIKTGRY